MKFLGSVPGFIIPGTHMQMGGPNSGRVFNTADVWINGIAGFCGFLVGYY